MKPRIPDTIGERLAVLRTQLAARKLDAFLVLNRYDQYWLTGFTGEDGGVLVTPNGVTLITDGRFSETADTEAPWARKVLRVARGPDSFAKVLKRAKTPRVGFEPEHMSVNLFAELSKLIRPLKLHSAGGIISTLRRAKHGAEMAAIRKAVHIAQDAFNAVRREIRPGVTEAHIAARLSFEMKSRGAQGDAFAPIVAAGPRSSLPHYEPADLPIQRGEVVLIDWGARADWYVSDLTRVVLPTSIPPKLAKVYDAVRQAHDAAIEAIRPGVSAAAIDRVARNLIRRAGFDKEFSHALGHGIGLNVHESPRLGKKSKDVLAPGMVVTIEPGIYLPGVGGVRLEDDVLVTESGYEVLSSLPL